MRKLSVLLVLILIGLLAMSFIPVPVCSMTGSGTLGDPYMVYNVTDLQNINLNLAACYELANDIDASDTFSWNLKTDYNGNCDCEGGLYAGFIPIGNYSTPFIGTFNGAGYTISGLWIDRLGHDIYWPANRCCPGIPVGLFGKTDGATIYNVTLTNLSIFQETFAHDISFDSEAGGLVGWAEDSTISNVVVIGIISGRGVDIGGVIGCIYGGNIGQCGFAGYVYTDYEYGGAGGFASFNQGGFISQCFSIGTVIGEFAFGFAGSNCGEIINCFSRSDVYTIDPLYGSVCGFLESGGGGDYCWDTLTENCYSTGYVGDTDCGFWNELGTHGDIETGLFWDTQTSESSDGCGDAVIGKTTAQMKTESTFTNAGWDFDTVWGIDETGVFNDGYPFLLWGIPWGDYIIRQVVWFQPNDIISGATLPDRTTDNGEQDGDITWGENPDGVSGVLGPFISSSQPTPVLPNLGPAPKDVMPQTGGQGIMGGLGTLSSNPFYPVISFMSYMSGLIPGKNPIPIPLMWVLVASFILVVIMALCVWKMPHQLITLIVGFGLVFLFNKMGIYPWWVYLIFIPIGLAVLLYERKPSL